MNETLTQIEETLLGWCARRVGHYVPVTVDTDLLNEGLLDSIMVMDLITSIEKHGLVELFMRIVRKTSSYLTPHTS